MKILLSDALSEECAQDLRDAGFDVTLRPGMERAELLAAVADVEGLVVRSATQVDSELFDAAPRLRVVGRAGSGVDNIDVDTATARGVLVMNTPGENTLSAAEHAVALLLGLCRHLGEADARMRSGAWSKKGLTGTELHGKTAGVVGLGRIGRAVAQRLRAFEMRVLGYDPFLPDQVAEKLGVELVELDDLIACADVISLHSPLTDRSRHLLDAASLARCKPGVLVVNAARGGLVDEAALLEALESGQVAGAALDVYEQEPLPDDSPLRAHPRTLLTPHLGASTAEAQRKVGLRIAAQISAFLNEGTVQNAVNLWALDATAARLLVPYVQLAVSMGRLAVQLLDERRRIARLEVECAGKLVDFPQEALTASILEGFLGSILDHPVNQVNARAAANELGYPVASVTGTDTDGYAGLLTLRVHPQGGAPLEIAGTVFGDRYPKVVRIDDFHVETRLRGEMLLVRNDDRPGRLAAITSVIAGLGVNIADMALGRDKRTGSALCVLHLDGALNDDGLEAMRAVAGVSRVQSLGFPKPAVTADAEA